MSCDILANGTEGDVEELLGEDGDVERVGLEEDDEVMRNLGDPSLPSPEDVAKHCRQGHIPYRNWCHICVKSQGRDMDHRQGKDREKNLPEYSWDYCFPGDEHGNKLTILVGKEQRSKSWMAVTVPEKGGTGKFAVDKCLDFIEENGDRQGNIIVKTDQEPSIKCLIEAIIEAREGGKTIPEQSPKSSGGQFQSSGSNGIVERGVQEMEGKIRALYLGLEDCLGRKVDAREKILTFMPEYAAYLINRLHKGLDGKVPYQRVKGKKPSILSLEFGEKVHFKNQLKSAKLEKLNARWSEGIFVGIRRKSNEVMVAHEDGIALVRSVKRVPIEHRWGDNLKLVKFVPWHKYRGDEYADGDIPEGVPADAVPIPCGDRTIFIRTQKTPPREFYITLKDIQRHKPTRGCSGCSSLQKNRGVQPHSEECRKRFLGILAESDKVKNAEKRKREFHDLTMGKRGRNETIPGGDEGSENVSHPEAASSHSEPVRRAKRGLAEAGIDADDGREETGIDEDVLREMTKALEEQDAEMGISLVEKMETEVCRWINEIEAAMGNEEEYEVILEKFEDGVWDDVHGGYIPLNKVIEAKGEEINFMDPSKPVLNR